MNEKEFVALVERLESYSHEQPEFYRLRVALLAVLGYFVLFGTIGSTFLIAIAVIYVLQINFLTIKLLIVPIGFAVVLLRSFRLDFPEPEGEELKFSDAPRLFDLAKKIRAATQGPPVHKILVTGEFNASMLQRPRLGLLGWPRNYLIVGLPLMQALSPTDVRAVLTHELGHLSGNHGKFSSWVYGVRQIWIQVLENLRKQRYNFGLFERFFAWYAPYFNAYSFVLARRQEYEADQCSARLVGRQASARALINLHLKERVVEEEFLPALFKRADKEPRPPDNAFNEMLTALKEPVPADKKQLWFSRELTRHHEYHDTHPALGDRLVALGFPNIRQQADVTVFQTEERGESGLEHFLNKLPKGLVERRNKAWQARVNEAWVDRFHYVREAERSLAKLNERAQSVKLTLDETWDRARFVAGTQDSVAAIPYLREVIQMLPDHAAANYRLGEALLAQGEEAGIQHLETCMDKDYTSIPASCELIYFFLKSQQRETEAEKYRTRTSDYYTEIELAEQERNTVSKKDDFTSHGLEREAIAALRLQLGKYPQLASAYLVKKVVKHFPDKPSFVLGVVAKHHWYHSQNQNDSTDVTLVTQLAQNVNFPGYTYIIALEKNYKLLRKRFEFIAGSEIYRG
jgi:Zn-dependent protease with chaperone function